MWQRDAGFRSRYLSVLADAPFAAYRWETPPVTRQTVDRPFEFILFDAPELLVSADAEAFVEYCTGTAADEGVVGFSNLGKDAYLLAPC